MRLLKGPERTDVKVLVGRYWWRVVEMLGVWLMWVGTVVGRLGVAGLVLANPLADWCVTRGWLVAIGGRLGCGVGEVRRLLRAVGRERGWL